MRSTTFLRFIQRPQAKRTRLLQTLSAGAAALTLSLGAGSAVAQTSDTSALLSDLRARGLPVTAETLNQALLRQSSAGPSADECRAMSTAELDAAIAANQCCDILSSEQLSAAAEQGFCLDTLAARLGTIAPAAGATTGGFGTPVDEEDPFRDDDREAASSGGSSGGGETGGGETGGGIDDGDTNIGIDNDSGDDAGGDEETTEDDPA